MRSPCLSCTRSLCWLRPRPLFNVADAALLLPELAMLEITLVGAIVVVVVVVVLVVKTVRPLLPTTRLLLLKGFRLACVRLRLALDRCPRRPLDVLPDGLLDGLLGAEHVTVSRSTVRSSSADRRSKMRDKVMAPPGCKVFGGASALDSCHRPDTNIRYFSTASSSSSSVC